MTDPNVESSEAPQSFQPSDSSHHSTDEQQLLLSAFATGSPTQTTVSPSEKTDNEHRSHKIQDLLGRSFLLAFALLLGLFLFWQMMMRVHGSIPRNYIVLGLLDAGLCIVVLVLLNHRLPKSAKSLMPICVLLSDIGIAEITRIDYEQMSNGVNSDIGLRQMVWFAFALGISALLIVFLHDYRSLRKISYACMAIGLALLICPMIPGLGEDINGAQVWIHIGPFSCQPSEFAKLFLAIFFAAYLFDRRDSLAVGGKVFMKIHWPRLRDFGPLAAVWIISMLVLIMEHDLGISLMLFAMYVGMLYVASNRKSWLLIGAVAFIIGVILADRIFPNFANRVTIWLNPFSQALYDKSYGGSYQIVQGLFGLAAGGLFGTGMGAGHPTITPFANSDFIYASLGEETGFVTLVVLLILYLTIIATGFVAAMHVTDGFGKLLASGLAFSMAFQIFTIVGGITLVIPLTGVTLPYIAAGGSSLIANWILAILILIIDNAAHVGHVPQVTWHGFKQTPRTVGDDTSVTDTMSLEAIKEYAEAQKNASGRHGAHRAVDNEITHSTSSSLSDDSSTSLIPQLDSESSDFDLTDWESTRHE